MTRIIAVGWLLVIGIVLYWEGRAHVECIKQGGSPVLGWFLDGCEK